MPTSTLNLQNEENKEYSLKIDIIDLEIFNETILWNEMYYKVTLNHGSREF